MAGIDHEDGGDTEDLEIAGDNELTLDDVLRMGGTKRDYVMLAGMEDVDEMVDGGKKGGIDDLEEGELKAFIEKLGLSKMSVKITEEEDTQAKKNEKEKESDVSISKKPIKNKKIQESQTNKDTEKNKKNKVDQKKVTNSSATTKSKGRPVFDFFERPILLIKPGGKWYDHEYTKEYTGEPQNEDNLKKYKSLAEKLHEHEVNLYRNKKELQKGANSAWMKTVVSTGTLGDRMAAMTVYIQDAPVHTLQFIENLINLIRKQGSKRQNLMALDTFKELLLSDLLPDNRKLRSFAQHPFHKLEELSSGNRDARDRRLILWYFEGQLKKHVAEFVKVLETLSHDNLIATKAKSLNVALELLCNKPEEEKSLLVLLVNKLGDPQYRIATKASYLLEMLLNKHPNMKVVVCTELERLLYRPNISEKAQYYGVCFLNQTILSHDEVDLANQLITVYFSFFRACIKKKEIDSKILRALLTGVNRSYPYANIASEKVKEQLDTLFRIVHVVSFNTGVQVLMLLFQVMDSQHTISNRYYSALYRKLLDPGLSQGSRQTMFLNLLFKSLKADVVLRRVKAFVKRLLQVTCGQKPAFICGALYLLSEIMRLKPGLKVLLEENGEEDEEEHFHDMPDDDDDDDDEEDRKKSTNNSDKIVKSGNTVSSSSWVHQQTLHGLKNSSQYDPLNRNPLFCGADNTSLWELKKLTDHFHPSVSLFAKTILEGNSIQYTGDPLTDFTLMRFLDRFVYRNPKVQKEGEVNRGYLMHRQKKYLMNEEKQHAVNSTVFLEKEEEEIPVDEVFFHRFFKKAALEKRKLNRKRDEDEESFEDVDDDEFEQILDSHEGDSFFTGLDGDVDFAGNLQASDNAKKKTSGEGDSDSDWEVDEEGDDEEISLDSMGEEDFENGDDESGGVFMDTSETSENITGPKKGKKRSLNQDTMFSAAEEFGDMLDENFGSKFDNIGLNAMANKDNASIKQLKWETERDNWVHNKDAKSIIKKKKQFNQKKLNKKRK
ncbi:CCAAT/enhancer-binding protein zeta [Bombina bombina]|uniref:CCAAT/enhancer-binding protein zeta n=1 Tax=Bombina bombina TaxID=8345 RepID=UPI00235A5F2A|nr:CCAAT/enhancer-binding protein zeta [Bombina bombina]